MLDLLKTLWRSWKRAVHGLNTAISLTLMTVVYVVAMAPVALGFRVFRPDALDRGLGSPDATTFWKPVGDLRQDVRRAQRPW